MKVLLLADAGTSHTIRWAEALIKCGINIQIASLAFTSNEYDSRIVIHSFGLDRKKINSSDRDFSKIKYLGFLSQVKKVIKDFQPDITHCHYASSYGLLGALSGFTPLIISVWGTDVFQFPGKSFLHRSILKYSLSKADIILSTSPVMASETSKYINKKIEITPFGVDLNKFVPKKKIYDHENSKIVIGTVKTLDHFYGIDTLIKAFSIVAKKHSYLNLELLIVGGGPQYDSLLNLCEILNISNRVTFTGQVSINAVPKYLNMLDIYVALSNSESFGVAIIEASACELPVIVSNVGGLPSVVDDGATGLIVPPNDPCSAAVAIDKLICNEELRTQLGKAGRKKVEREFEWHDCVNRMISIYENIAGKKI